MHTLSLDGLWTPSLCHRVTGRVLFALCHSGPVGLLLTTVVILGLDQAAKRCRRLTNGRDFRSTLVRLSAGATELGLYDGKDFRKIFQGIMRL